MTVICSYCLPRSVRDSLELDMKDKSSNHTARTDTGGQPCSHVLRIVDFLHLVAAGIWSALCQVVERPLVFSFPDVLMLQHRTTWNSVSTSSIPVIAIYIYIYIYIYMCNGFIFLRRIGAISYHSIGCSCNLLKLMNLNSRRISGRQSPMSRAQRLSLYLQQFPLPQSSIAPFSSVDQWVFDVASHSSLSFFLFPLCAGSIHIPIHIPLLIQYPH